MTDFEVIPMSEVEGSPRIRSIQKRLRGGVVSATRSDRLAAELLQRGLGPERIAIKLDEMLDAQMSRPKQTWDSEKKAWKTELVESPDWKAQATALKFLCDIHGFLFQLPKDIPVNINVNTLAIARDVDAMTPQQALRELPSAIKILESLDPKVREAIEGDAEVVGITTVDG